LQLLANDKIIAYKRLTDVLGLGCNFHKEILVNNKICRCNQWTQ